MARAGLRLTGLADESVALDVTGTLPRVAPGTLVVVAVKTGSLPGVADALAENDLDRSAVLTIQNGLNPDTVLERLLGERRATPTPVLRAITSAACNLVEPGLVEYWGGGWTFPGGSAHDGPADLFASAGVPVDRSADFVRDVWRKLAVNCVANALCAVLGERNNTIVSAQLARVRREIVDEVRACAARAGVTLDDGLSARVDDALATSLNRNSMVQDIAYGRVTEIDELNGFVDRAAAEASAEAPANRTLARLVRFRASGAGRSGRS
jgi:2-dehydropantoate 2-reductase